MNHYIIDHNKRQEYIYLFFLFITISFGAGFTFGYMHGLPADENKPVESSHKIAASVLESPTSPGTSTITQPRQTKITAEKRVSNKPATPSIKKTKDTKSTKNKTNTSVIVSASKPPVKSAAMNKVNKPIPTVTPIKVEEIQPATVNKRSPSKPTSDIKKSVTSKYLIQVGLFANRENAATFIEQLKKNGFDGYFEGFISTSGAEKYNVRLGPFDNKNAAQKKMADFQKQHDSSAYILSSK